MIHLWGFFLNPLFNSILKIEMHTNMSIFAFNAGIGFWLAYLVNK